MALGLHTKRYRVGGLTDLAAVLLSGKSQGRAENCQGKSEKTPGLR